MSKFNVIVDEVLDESRSVLTKRRSFYPRKIQELGGLSNALISNLRRETKRLKSEDPSITNQQILKALEFELNGN